MIKFNVLFSRNNLMLIQSYETIFFCFATFILIKYKIKYFVSEDNRKLQLQMLQVSSIILAIIRNTKSYI